MIKLKLGDNLGLIKDIKDNTVDMILTSPPYDDLRNYNKSLNWNFNIFKELAKELWRVLKDGGVIIWVVGDKTSDGSETGTSFKQALYFKEIGFKLYDTMIYKKLNYMPLTHRRYEQEFEYMFCLTKGTPKTFKPILIPSKYGGKNTTAGVFKTSDDKTTKLKYKVKEERIKGNVFEYPSGSNYKGKYKHPAMFPLDLAIDQIKSWTNENDLVLDPFMGSGTTGVACKELGRDFIGMEIVDKYYEIAKQRLEEVNENVNQNQLSIFDVSNSK